jgi:hypothetical protein
VGKGVGKLTESQAIGDAVTSVLQHAQGNNAQAPPLPMSQNDQMGIFKLLQGDSSPSGAITGGLYRR